jgi:hypothetical protein
MLVRLPPQFTAALILVETWIDRGQRNLSRNNPVSLWFLLCSTRTGGGMKDAAPVERTDQ